MKRRSLSRALPIIIMTLLVAACVSPASPIPTSVSPTPTTESASGGSLTFPIAEEPPTLNPYLSQTGWEALITLMIYESLAAPGPDGRFYPVLAQELPTTENGGVSADGLTVTWKLRKDILWSDGQPFTAEDVKFTWEAVSKPESGATWAPGVDLIESIDTPDDYTVVIHYNQFYPDYLGQFASSSTGGQGVLPKHACGEATQMPMWDCNRNPVGTGPFVLAEWKTGQYLRLARNPTYHEQGKPLLDAILFPIVPDPEVHRQMMVQGNADVWFEMDQQYLDELEKLDTIRMNPGSDQWVLRLFFNLSARGSDDPSLPNPILADQKVREAILLGLDRGILNEGVYGGRATPVGHELYHGPFTCPDPSWEHDPERAKSLLEEAGWNDTNGDGVRECRQCLHGSEGQEMVLVFVVSSTGETDALTQSLIVDMLLDLGIKAEPRLEESSVRDDMALRGDFDLLMWSDGYGSASDPGEFLDLYYASAAIPPEGWNISRFRDAEVDDLLDKAKTVVDTQERQQIYCQLDSIVNKEVPVILLLVVPYPSAFSTRVEGWKANPNAMPTWDAANWWLK